jgi:hypothetical protein
VAKQRSVRIRGGPLLRIHKNTILHIQGNIHHSQGNNRKESSVAILENGNTHHGLKQHKES